MIRFALKNMAIKKVQVILILLSIVISAGVGILAFNVAGQVDDGITENAGYYSVIVGPTGSKTQLAMNSMYFSEEPLGTIPYSVVTDLTKDSRVKAAIPFAMADNYNGYGVVGTTAAFLAGRELREGVMFEDTMQVVVGSNIAKYNDLAIGDVIHTSHSANSTETHAEGLTVVGILKESHSSYDNTVFTKLQSLWEMHDHGAAEEGEEAHQHGKTVCAVLVNATNPGGATMLAGEYDGKIILAEDGDSFTLQAIEPMAVVRDVLQDADNTKYIVFVLCAVILIMNVMIISIITLLNMYHSAGEIALMRLIGIGMKKINLLYMFQNGLIGLLSCGLAFGVSRLCLFFMNDYISTMGVVLNIGKVYPLEFLILGGIFLISVLPTAIWTFMMSRKDSLAS